MYRKFIYLLLPIVLFVAEPASAEQAIDRVVAIVNNQVITNSVLMERVNEVKGDFIRRNEPTPPDYIIREKILESLVYQKLQMQMVERNHITVDEEEIDKAIARIAASNHVSLATLEKKVLLDGTTYTDFRKKISDQIAIQKMQGKAIAQNVHVTEEEIQKELKKLEENNLQNRSYHLAHILVSIPDEPTSDQLKKAQAEAERITKKVKDGADFNKTAVENSKSFTLSADDLGWRKYSELPTIFSDKVAKMKTHEIAGPIKAPNGFHIIKLIETKDAEKVLSHKDVNEMIFQRKFREELELWLKRVKEAAFVKILL